MEPVPVIHDTDMCGDCDDAGALAILHRLADLGEARIVACGVDSRDEARAAGAAVSAINTYHGRPNIPLGGYRGFHSPIWNSHFTARIRDEFSHSAPPDDLLPSAIQVYRKALAAEKDGSVVIASTGFLTILHELLLSVPDAESPLNGVELIHRKVRRLVVMGGFFPRSSGTGREFNFVNINEDGRDARYVADYWPTPVLFTGYEIGNVIQTGTILAANSSADPVRRAYELYPSNGGTALTHERPSWDQTAILAAVRAPELYWRVEVGGRCVVQIDGHNHWEPMPDGPHAYLIEQMPPAELALLISDLMADSSTPAS